MRTYKLAYVYLGLLGLYSVYSYTQVDPNLVLSNRPWFWAWQNFMWGIGYHNRLLSSLLYLGIVIGLSITYVLLLKALAQKKLTLQFGWRLIGWSVAVLVLAYPALSHDIFNYLMNAKMVWYYHANPHVKVALDFPKDPWLHFMNNVQTPAPYAYGFTAISIIPSLIGQNHLKITMWLFKGLMILGFYFLLKSFKVLQRGKLTLGVLIYGLNPLILIETVGNSHNDVLMMAVLFWAFVAFLKALQGSRWWFLGALVLFLLSVSIKYATLMVFLGMGLYWGLPFLKQKISFGGAQTIAHYVPLLTTQSQRFLPWYLNWSLSFLPFTQEILIRDLIVLSSFCGLLSYLPYLYTGEYTPQLLALRSVILFVPPLSYGLTRLLLRRFQSRVKQA